MSDQTPKKCPWWKRWWHRRQRNADRLVLFPAIRDRAEMAAAQTYRRFGNEWRIDRDFRMFGMLDMHASGLGQGHWGCACAKFVRWENKE